MKKLFILSLGLIPLLLNAQIIGEQRSILSLTSTCYQKKPDVFGSSTLIAASAFADKSQIGFYGENRFMVKSHSPVRFAMCVPVGKGAVSFSGNYLGANEMHLYGLSAGHGLKLTNKLGIGLKIDAGIFSVSHAEKLKMIGYQGGIIYQLSEKTIGGFHFSNKRYLMSNKFNIPPGSYAVTAGIGHQINPSIFISCEIFKETDKPVSIAPNMSWNINSAINLKAGLMPPLNDGYIGIGWNRKKQGFFIGISSHAYLGFSGAISYVYDIK
jgi:hypothetical protein